MPINRIKTRIKKIGKSPSVGLVNGLYATSTGIGGLTIIQVMRFPSSKMLELNLTGKQGDVMKESVNYALRIAFGLLTKKQQQKTKHFPTVFRGRFVLPKFRKKN